MNDVTRIVSKVLVHECDDEALNMLKMVCTENNLVGLKVSTGDNSIGLKDASNEIDDVLRSNVDLGAIFLTETTDYRGVSGLQLCKRIHNTRPELPIFLRRESKTHGDDLEDEVRNAVTGYYTIGDKAHINALINEYVCSMYYPIQLAQGIEDIAKDAFGNMIANVEVRCDLPYLVKDQIIYGELFSLIPLESNWCRGYMMLQTTENEVLELIRSGRTHIKSSRPDYRDTNSILNELTNMMWGGIKARYFSGNDDQAPGTKTQVPIIVNHSQKHISFGSTEPQLCFKFTLHDPAHNLPDIVVYQRLIFNLSWSPEKFLESDKAVEDFVESGDLEFF